MLNVGDVPSSLEQIRELPVGSIIKYRSSTDARYERTNSNTWQRVGSSRIYSTESFSNCNRYEVAQIGGGEIVQETVEMFMQRFRMHTLAAINSNGPGGAYDATRVVRDAVPEALPYPGLVVPDMDLMEFPRGTLISTGREDDYSRFGLFLRHSTATRWNLILGRAAMPYNPVTVVEVPNCRVRTEWIDEDERLLREFKAKMWNVGWEQKVEHSWCNTYEQVMKAIGIDASSARPLTTQGGTIVTPEQARHYAEGSVFAFITNVEDRWAWTMRTPHADNRARTRRIMGSPGYSERHLGHFSDRMEVLYDGGGRMAIQGNRRMLDLAPEGTTMRYNGTTYVKDVNQMWSGVPTPGFLTDDYVIFTGFPVPS